MQLVVTGASGFIGSQVLTLFNSHSVKTIGRTHIENVSAHFTAHISPDTNYGDFFNNVDCVIHCAARVHVMDERSISPLEEFRQSNVYSTLNLARQAAQAGVKRFIFLSTVKVNGEQTRSDNRFTEADLASPKDPYGKSKFEAENGLIDLAKQTGMDVVILRPPLVYGPGVKGNMFSLLKLVDIGIPLPLDGIKNYRSMVSVNNLVSLIKVVTFHPKAANQIFMVSDGDDLSTSALVKGVARGLNKRVWFLPIPVGLARLLLGLFGKGDLSTRLFDSLRVDISKAKHLLSWEPPFSVEEGIQDMCKEFSRRD
jgi:nucleoside-diphosphate-sugar epimerase